MVNHKRRMILAVPAALTIGRVIPTIPLAAVFTSRPAQAELITAGLALASVAIGFIQANNQSDDGMSAILSAGLEYQRTAAQQLLSIQDALKAVLVKLNGIGSEVEDVFLKGRLTALTTDLRAAIIRYRDELDGARDYTKGYAAWQSDENVRFRLRDISREVDSAVAKLEAEKWLNASTALLFPSAMNLTFSVRTALGESREQLAGPARRFWNLMELVKDSKQEGSAAKELELLSKKLQDSIVTLKGLGLVIPQDEQVQSSKALLKVVTVEDYTGPIRYMKYVRLRPSRMQIQLGTIDNFLEVPAIEPERIGKKTTFAIRSSVPQKIEKTQNGNLASIGIRQMGIPQPIEAVPYYRHSYMASVQIVDDKIPIVRYTANGETERKAALQPLGIIAEGEKRREDLELAISTYNVIGVRIAMCLAALNTMTQTQNNLTGQFWRGMS